MRKTPAARKTAAGAVVKDEQFADDEEAKALLAEAEELIEGEKP